MDSRAPERIRVGIVGACPVRGWGSRRTPARPRSCCRVRHDLVAARQASAWQTAAPFGVPHAFAGAGELVAHPDVDLVVVSVKLPGHAGATRAAVAVGKHVSSATKTRERRVGLRPTSR